MHVMESAFDPTYGEAWNARQVGDALSMPTTQAIVVDERGAILNETHDGENTRDPAGFVLTRYAADEEELLLIAVAPAFRGRGLGRALIYRLLENSRERGVTRIFLEMREGNPAIHLYQKLGFEPIGRRPKYYRLSNGQRVDAITFGRVI